MTDQFNSVSSSTSIADLATDALGVPLAHVGLQWSYREEPAPGDLVWADQSRLARLLVVDGVPHLLLADGNSAPAAGRVARKVLALYFEEDLGFPGNLLIPAPWDQGGVHHGS